MWTAVAIASSTSGCTLIVDGCTRCGGLAVAMLICDGVSISVRLIVAYWADVSRDGVVGDGEYTILWSKP